MLLIALLAVDDLRTIRSVGCLHIYVAFVAFSLEELARISQGHAVEVPLVGMSSRDRELVLSIKFQLLLDDSEGFA